jgi:hypothetical protein
MGYQGIDFAPQPAPGSNPFEPVVQGINLGFGIQNQIAAQKKSAQDMQIEKENQDLKRLGTAFEVFSKLGATGQQNLWEKTIAPLGSRALGQEFPSTLPENVHPFIDEANKAYTVHSKDPKKFTKSDLLDTLNAISVKAAAAGNEKDFNLLDKMVGNIRPDTTTQYQQENLARQARLDAGKLRVEFLNRPEVKEFVTINTQVKSMDALLNKALSSDDVKNKVAVDQALISMFNKLTDPASVVRESEYARTPENLPIINRIIGAITKLDAGGAGLTNEESKAG